MGVPGVLVLLPFGSSVTILGRGGGIDADLDFATLARAEGTVSVSVRLSIGSSLIKSRLKKRGKAGVVS